METENQIFRQAGQRRVKTHTVQKIKLSVKDFLSKCGQLRSFSADLVTFTEEILHGKHFFTVSLSTRTWRTKHTQLSQSELKILIENFNTLYSCDCIFTEWYVAASFFQFLFIFRSIKCCSKVNGEEFSGTKEWQKEYTLL